MKTTPRAWAARPGATWRELPKLYDHLSYFYSDLFELGYEAVGELDPRLETFRGLEGTLQ